MDGGGPQRRRELDGVASVVGEEPDGGGDSWILSSIPRAVKERRTRRREWWTSICTGCSQSSATSSAAGGLVSAMGEKGNEREGAGERVRRGEDKGGLVVLLCSSQGRGAEGGPGEARQGVVGGLQRARQWRGRVHREEDSILRKAPCLPFSFTARSFSVPLFSFLKPVASRDFIEALNSFQKL